MPVTLPAEPLRRLRVLVTKSKRNTSVRFPISFVREQQAGDKPPLAELVQAGDVRLKLHLTLALMATKAPHRIDDPPPAGWLAGALGLPEESGARRISEALRWLHDREFIVRTRGPGRAASIEVIRHGSVSATSGRYVQAPLALWQEGWILNLTARALAIFLVVREATGGQSDRAAKLSASRKSQYALSPETWARAADDLIAAGLLDVEEVFARASGRDEWGPKRRRLQYTLVSDSILDLGPIEVARLATNA